MHTSRVVTAVAVAMLSSAMLTSATVDAGAADSPPPRPRPGYPPPPPYPPMPPLMPFYNWSGVYVGAHIGGGFSDIGFGNTASGFLGGGQIGYNYQIGRFVLGLEAEISGTDVSNGFATVGPLGVSVNWNSLTTLTPRFGWAFNDWLIYGKIGGAWADVDVRATEFGFPFAAGGGVSSGFVLGVGVEHALWIPNWTAKIEYENIDFGHDGGTFVTTNGVTFQTVKFGINYHFGGPFLPPY